MSPSRSPSSSIQRNAASAFGRYVSSSAAIAGRLPRRVKRNQIERRRIRGAVVRRVADEVKMRQFSATKFMHDLARFGVAPGIAGFRLPEAQYIQRALGEFGPNDHILQRSDQAVAAEWRHEPWQTGGRHVDLPARAFHGQTQRAHVVDRLAVHPVEFFVAGIRIRTTDRATPRPAPVRSHAPPGPEKPALRP